MTSNVTIDVTLTFLPFPEWSANWNGSSHTLLRQQCVLKGQSKVTFWLRSPPHLWALESLSLSQAPQNISLAITVYWGQEIGRMGEYSSLSKERAQEMPADLKETVILAGSQGQHVDSWWEPSMASSQLCGPGRVITPVPTRPQVSSFVNGADNTCPVLSCRVSVGIKWGNMHVKALCSLRSVEQK